MTDNKITLQAEAYDATDASKNNLSEESVIKALECCVVSDCAGCPKEEQPFGCYFELTINALDLINRLKGERDCYRNELRLTNIEKEGINKVCGEQKVEIERLQELHALAVAEREANVKGFTETFATVKSEAIKEFAERLKEDICNICHDRVFEYDEVESTIENLVKELTEERDNGN